MGHKDPSAAPMVAAPSFRKLRGEVSLTNLSLSPFLKDYEIKIRILPDNLLL